MQGGVRPPGAQHHAVVSGAPWSPGRRGQPGERGPRAGRRPGRPERDRLDDARGRRQATSWRPARTPSYGRQNPPSGPRGRDQRDAGPAITTRGGVLPIHGRPLSRSVGAGQQADAGNSRPAGVENGGRLAEALRAPRGPAVASPRSARPTARPARPSGSTTAERRVAQRHLALLDNADEPAPASSRLDGTGCPARTVRNAGGGPAPRGDPTVSNSTCSQGLRSRGPRRERDASARPSTRRSPGPRPPDRVRTSDPRDRARRSTRRRARRCVPGRARVSVHCGDPRPGRRRWPSSRVRRRTARPRRPYPPGSPRPGRPRRPRRPARAPARPDPAPRVRASGR